MNYRIVLRLLGIVAWLIGGAMTFSLPACLPQFGGQANFEIKSFWALVISIVVCVVAGWTLRRLGHNAPPQFFRKEAMGVVGLSWILATILGALPYLLADVVFCDDGSGEQTMGITECVFESQSGFSTTGATVLTDIENETWVPRSILFWRSSTHFLGGLGIIVLFVALLGQGSAGKVLMRTEMPGPESSSTHERMQHTAWRFAAIYCALNLMLCIILKLEGMTWFESLCHAFGTLATGGFSTRNASLGGFDSAVIEYTVVLFMVLAGTNFTLMYVSLLGNVRELFRNVEWLTYISILALCSLAVFLVGNAKGDFSWEGNSFAEMESSMRDSLFQVVSIMTTTGFGTTNFNDWNNFSRALLVLLMFVGGCAGSTGGGMKVIRHVLLFKILHNAIVCSFRPTLVKPIRVGRTTFNEDPSRPILVYFGLVFVTFAISWLLLVAIEPDSTWTNSGQTLSNKLVDAGSAISATLHNIGPGLGIVGATENYSSFSAGSKLLFTLLMMLGRLEFYVILVLIVPAFWRRH